MLAETKILNYVDGYQEITIQCPKSGQQSTIGTYLRGQGKKITTRGKEPLLRDMGRPLEPQIGDNEEENGSRQPQADVNSFEEAQNFHNTLRN